MSEYDDEDLESLETPCTIVQPIMGVWPEQAPDKATYITIDFEKGDPVAIDGKRYDDMPMTQTAFHHATPIYEELDGWWEDITKARTEDELPENARRYIARIEEICRTRVSVVGVGPGREENVVRTPLI